MESFVELQPFKSMQYVYALRKMYHLVEGNIRDLTSLRVSPDTYSKLLVHLLIKKIPHDLRLVIFHDFNDQV